MAISLNLIGSDFKDYTFRSHVLKPTVLLVGSLALALFISIGLVNLFGWRRPIHRVGPVGEVPGGAANVPIKYSFSLAAVDHVAPNGVDLVRLPTILIDVANSIVDSRPYIALMTLSKLIFITGVTHPLFVRLLDDQLNPLISNDGGGVGREWMTRVFQGLKNFRQNDDPSDSFHLQSNKGLLVPQGEWIGEEMIPNREILRDIDSESIIPLCVQMHFPIFYAIGAVLTYVYYNPRRYVIGPVFHEAIFAAILSLTNDEIDSVYSELTNSTKLKMCRALMISQLKSGEEDLEILMPVLNFLEKAEAGTMITDEEIVAVKDFYASTCDILDPDDVTENKFLLLVKPTEEASSAQDQKLSFVLPTFNLNIPVIRANMDEFYISCLTHFLNKKEDSLGIIGKTLYPIHMMAKGMKGVLTPTEFRTMRKGVSIAEALASTMNSMGITPLDPTQVYVLPDDPAIAVRDKIQGVLDRSILVEKIVIHEGCNGSIRNKVEWLKQWILRPETTDKQLSALLIVWGGSSAVDVSPGSVLNIIPQKAIHDEKGNVIQPLSPTPSGGTCFWNLKISPVDFVGTEGNLADNTPEAFFNVLDTISDGKDNKWTQA